MERHIQADNAFIKWMEAMSKNVVHIADAWYAAVKWADSHPHWISVEDELPPKMDKYSKRSNCVLVVTERKEFFMAKYWYNVDGWAVSGFPTSKVTHWMPLPSAPRKETTMKARIKTTGKVINVVQHGGTFIGVDDDDLYSVDEIYILNEPDRQQVRIQFVGQIASAILSNYEFYAEGIAEECKRSGKSRPEMVAQMSLEITDALIEGLEKGGQDGD